MHLLQEEMEIRIRQGRLNQRTESNAFSQEGTEVTEVQRQVNADQSENRSGSNLMHLLEEEMEIRIRQGRLNQRTESNAFSQDGTEATEVQT